MKIERKSNLEEKQGKNGKTYHTGGIVVNNQWYNAMFGFPDQIKKFEALVVGEEATNIELYEEEYNGKSYKKFKFVSQSEAKIKELELRIEKLERNSI